MHAADGPVGSVTRRVALVLIHDVRDRSDQPKHSAAQRQAYRAEDIILFDSYVTAALEAFKLVCVCAHLV